MVELRRIGIWSAAKVQAVMMAIFGLFAGIFYAAMGALISASGVPGVQGSGGFMLGFGFLSIIILPIIYAVFGLISGAIGALIYNAVAALIGGLDLKFVKRQ